MQRKDMTMNLKYVVNLRVQSSETVRAQACGDLEIPVTLAACCFDEMSATPLRGGQ